MERESLKFHRNVRRVYLQTARKEKNRFVVVDASQSPESTYQEMLEKLIDKLPRMSRVKLNA